MSIMTPLFEVSDKTIELLARIRLYYPYLRLGQIINFMFYNRDIFYLEDKDWVEGLEKLIAEGQ